MNELLRCFIRKGLQQASLNQGEHNSTFKFLLESGKPCCTKGHTDKTQTLCFCTNFAQFVGTKRPALSYTCMYVCVRVRVCVRVHVRGCVCVCAQSDPLARLDQNARFFSVRPSLGTLKPQSTRISKLNFEWVRTGVPGSHQSILTSSL